MANIDSDIKDPLIRALRMKRRTLELSQRELGERIGRTQEAISTFEMGTNPSLNTIRRIAKALDMKLELTPKKETKP